MSHFSVLVINTKGIDDVEIQLHPFDENIEMPRYELGPVTEDEIERFCNYYKERDKSLGELSPKDLYEIKGDDWNCGRWEFISDDEVIEYSTYNPNSEWDWYQEGGRWAGMLKLKKGVSPIQELNPSWGWKQDEIEEANRDARVDKAFFKDIDWEGMVSSEEIEKVCRFWELYVEGEKPKNKKEKEIIQNVWHNPDYYKDKYKDKLTYAKAILSFRTYAVLMDGQWISPGEMGWLGISSESLEDGTNWELDFFDRFLKDLPDNALLTVVDCHI